MIGEHAPAVQSLFASWVVGDRGLKQAERAGQLAGAGLRRLAREHDRQQPQPQPQPGGSAIALNRTARASEGILDLIRTGVQEAMLVLDHLRSSG